MRASIHRAGLIAFSALAGAPAIAQTESANNQAFINQMSAAGRAIVVNDTTFVQSGVGNQLGSSGNTVFQTAIAAGAANRLDVRQTSNGNLVGFAFDGVTALPVGQHGTGNVARLTQEGGDRNVVGRLQQRSQGSLDVTNALTIVLTGRENYLYDVEQQNTGPVRNAAIVILTGQRNGFLAGTVQPRETRSGALSGMTGMGALHYIGTADAPLSVYAGLDGAGAYPAPNSRPGASLLQVGSANRAEVTVAGDDNNFQIDQNSRSGLAAQTANLTNAVAWNVAGSSNYLYAVQVGAGNTVTNVVVGQQNALLAYQAGEGGAAEAGYGNVVAWRQGNGAGDLQNSAEMVQLGINNTIAGAQFGSLNVFRGYQRGTGNAILAVQIGSGHVADIVQTGSGNTATVQQGPSAAIPIPATLVPIPTVAPR